MFYFNLYNLNNHEAGYPYTPIPIKQLAPFNVVKPDAPLTSYTEYDMKNIIAANSITGNSYTVTSSTTEGQGRVMFAAGQKIILNGGFKVINGGYFHGYIDSSIGAMNCTDPPSKTDCSGQERLSFELDTITDADSIIVKYAPDSLTIPLCKGDTIHPNASYPDKTVTSFNWDFGNGRTSTLRNPAIYYTSTGNYLLTLITTSPTKKDTTHIHINVYNCNNKRTTYNNQQVSNNLNTGIKIIPNPSNGVFSITSQSAIQFIQVQDMLGNIIYSQSIINSTLNMDIDLRNKPKGIYIIKLQTIDKIFTEKIIIQ